MDPRTVFVLGVVFVATLIRSALGFGEALISVPLLALVMPVSVAAPLAVLVSVTVAAVLVVQDWRHIELRSAGWLVVSALLGIPVGVYGLTHVDDHLVKLFLGLLIAAFSLYSLTTRTGRVLDRDHLGSMLGFGFCSGVLGGAYGMNGPPLVVYGALRGWSPQQFRATLQGYFLCASLVGLAAYALSGVWVSTVNRYYWQTLPATLAGLAIGGALHRRLEGRGFYRVVFAALVLTGLTLVVQALSGQR